MTLKEAHNNLREAYQRYLLAKLTWHQFEREFGEAMREQREKAGVSLRNEAKRLGISAAHLSDIERGWRGVPKCMYGSSSQ